MKRSTVAMAVLALVAAGAALAYQTAARDRDYRALLARGDAALRDDQTFGAIEAYSGAIALRPDSMLAHLRRAESYHRRGELDASARDYRTAASLSPTATRPLDELGDVLYQLERYGRAADSYEARLRLDDRSASVTYKMALARYRDGNLDAALAAVKQAIHLDDHLADAYYLLGLCLREKGQLAEAERAQDQAVTLEPGLIPAHEELADLDAAQGRREDELEQLQLLAGLDRGHIERQVAVGLADARAGHPDLAVLTLGNALERTPDQPLVYGALGRVWLDIAQARSDRVALSKALSALARVASGATATSEVLTLYGRALLLDGQADAAERTLLTATTRYPVDPSAFLFYAAAAERQGHLDAARHSLVTYGTLVSDDRELVHRSVRIAALSLRLNDAATAVAWLRRAERANPTDVSVLASLANAEISAGDRDEARGTIARGLEREPGNKALALLARRLR